jgi:putative aldouronate transport system substrate-binding protein
MAHLTRRTVFAGAFGSAAAMALAACGSSDKKKSDDYSANRAAAMDKYNVGDQFKATEAVSFPIMVLNNSAYPYKADWMFWSKLTELTNVTLQATVVPGSDYSQKRSVMVSSGDAPFIIPKTYHPDEEAYISGGAILPVSDYIDLMPNFKAKVEKWKMQPDLDTYREADGKFYLLPGMHEDVWLDYSLAVRTDVLQKLNLQEPTTWDEVYTVLKAMKEDDPANYPMSDRWSHNPPEKPAGNLLGILSDAFGTYAGWAYQNAYFDTKQSKFVLTGTMDEYKQMVTYLNKLVSEKLLDPESFTQQDDQARQKWASGKTKVMSCNAQTLVNECRKDIANIPGATVKKIARPMGPLGAVKTALARLENGVMISKKARDSKNFVAMMQFIDWLYYSDAGQLFAKWGVQGTTYTGSVDDGTFKLAPDVNWGGLNPSGTKQLQVEYGFSNGVFAYGGPTKLLNSQFPAEEQKFQEVMNGRKTLPLPPPAPLNADEREQATLWQTAIQDHVFQNTVKFILGTRPLSEWDKYVAELKGKNSQQYIDVVNKAYERFKNGK